ncbi:hypothetical protein SLA2020_397920 [Shorea laevis]
MHFTRLLGMCVLHTPPSHMLLFLAIRQIYGFLWISILSTLILSMENPKSCCKPCCNMLYGFIARYLSHQNVVVVLNSPKQLRSSRFQCALSHCGFQVRLLL